MRIDTGHTQCDLVGVGLSDDVRTGLLEFSHDSCITFGDVIFEEERTRRCADARGFVQIFDRDRDAGQCPVRLHPFMFPFLGDNRNECIESRVEALDLAVAGLGESEACCFVLQRLRDGQGDGVDFHVSIIGENGPHGRICGRCEVRKYFSII